MSLEAFGVKNLRCLTDTGLVPIRPITVLVGRNSSGKSTFLRAFPLLRQSVETARNSPILWYDSRYVDFGSLRDAANNRLSEPSVAFKFRVGLPAGSMLPFIEIAMSLAGAEDPYVSTYEICAGGAAFRWEFDANGVARSLVEDGQQADLKGRFVGPTYQIRLGGKTFLFPQLRSGDTSGVTFSSVPEAFELSDDEIRKLALDFMTHHVFFPAERSFPIVELADSVLPRILSRVAYLAPLRVSAERAYRIQNLAVDEVDPDGKNLAMFLRSLSPEESESLAAFTRDALGFETTIRTMGHHAEILVKEGSGRRFVNLVDVGFGYSEVLPLAAVLWANCIRPTLQRREPAPLIAIEQPELHLHPAYQARLARMFVEAVSRAPGTKIIIETHSESLINGLGKLVFEGAIKAEDVQIALFDKDEETGETTVSLAGYRENGALRDWPYGFLSPGAQRLAPQAAE